MALAIRATPFSKKTVSSWPSAKAKLAVNKTSDLELKSFNCLFQILVHSSGNTAKNNGATTLSINDTQYIDIQHKESTPSITTLHNDTRALSFKCCYADCYSDFHMHRGTVYHILYIVYHISHVTCLMLKVVSKSYAVCRMSYVVCRMSYVVCRMS